MAGKITIEELAESTKEALQTDLTPIENKIQDVLAAAQAIEVKLQGEDALKQQLVNSLTALGFEVSMENELSELFEIVNGIKMGQGNAQPGDVVEGKTFTNDSGELLTGTLKKSSGTAAAAQVLTGYTFSNASGVGLSGSMANNGAKTFTPSASNQTAPAGYYSSVTCNAVANLTAANIKKGVVVGGVTGTCPTPPNSAYMDRVNDFNYVYGSKTYTVTHNRGHMNYVVGVWARGTHYITSSSSTTFTLNVGVDLNNTTGSASNKPHSEGGTIALTVTKAANTLSITLSHSGGYAVAHNDIFVVVV